MTTSKDYVPNGTPPWPRPSTAAAGASTAPASNEMEALVADAEDLVKNTADVVGVQTAAARAKLQATIASSKEWIAARAQVLGDHGRQAAGAVDDYVHESPWQAIGIAAALGAVLGALVARR